MSSQKFKINQPVMVKENGIIGFVHEVGLSGNVKKIVVDGKVIDVIDKIIVKVNLLMKIIHFIRSLFQ